MPKVTEHPTTSDARLSADVEYINTVMSIAADDVRQVYKIGNRVAAFSINANFTPAMSAHELILLMSSHNLPEDAELVTEHESCIVWRSPTLGRLLGNEYVEGFVEEADDKYAELITTAKPECE
jgi:hypothetical protein